MGFDIHIHRVLMANCAPDWNWDKKPVSQWPVQNYSFLGDKYFWNYNLWCVLGGKGYLRKQDVLWPLQRGDVFLLRGNEAFSGTNDSSNPLALIAVHFDFLDKESDIITPENMPFHHHFINMLFFENLLKRIEKSWRTKNTEQTQTWMKACLSEFISIGSLTIDTAQSEQKKMIQTICSEISRTPNRQYNLAELARSLNCSPRHFNRLFKQFIGVTPKEYILTMCLEAAKDMLLSSSLSVSRIAELIGFNDIYYFSKWFKAETGLPPSKYRQM